VRWHETFCLRSVIPMRPRKWEPHCPPVGPGSVRLITPSSDRMSIAKTTRRGADRSSSPVFLSIIRRDDEYPTAAWLGDILSGQASGLAISALDIAGTRDIQFNNNDIAFRTAHAAQRIIPICSSSQAAALLRPWNQPGQHRGCSQ
jgi:hypothetical protein